jgi:2-polyprenyl-3-methyl-5-hydroxy-6-metoxy-1,4-benzoquinol methylase
VRSLFSLLQDLKSAWAGAPSGPPPLDPAAPLQPDRLWRDGAYFWAAADARPEEVRRAMYERYPLIPRGYTDRYFDQILAHHRPNPMAPLYIESELGAPARQLALLAEIDRAGVRIEGRRCLDVGCSNGSLLLAAKQQGASECVGVDVSEGRIASARQLCEGAGIELLVLDLATTALPDGHGPFDVIFCTDVLEHVDSIPGILAAMKRHLAATPEARIFVTVFNHLSPASVASEPHYGVPGMVLVDRAAAEEIWMAVRGQLQSTLDYEVGHWPEYASLAAHAAAAGLRIIPHLDAAGVLANRRGFWAGYGPRLDELLRNAAARLDDLQMSSAQRALLADAVRHYCRESLASHQAFEAGLPQLPDEQVLAFYLRYYAQPIRFFLAHA